MTAQTIELPPLAAPVDELWHVLLDLGDQLTVGWALSSQGSARWLKHPGWRWWSVRLARARPRP